jgi:N-acetylglucosaminyldiphosphoundecaprenol N-acetyl-beta-D-mannosaminyltransferase
LPARTPASVGRSRNRHPTPVATHSFFTKYRHDRYPMSDANVRTFVGGVPITKSSLSEAVEWLYRRAMSREPESVRLVNAFSVASADKSIEYRDLLRGKGTNFADGTPVAWLAARQLAVPREDIHVRGPSLFSTTLETRELRAFFVGSTNEVLEAIRIRVESPHYRAHFAGAYSPPFGPLTPRMFDDIAAQIPLSDVDVIWVGMGTPKQDFIATKLASVVGLPCVAVGAAFDFLAGSVGEAPRWTRDYGLEWLHRLSREPRRLAGRYTVGNLRFARAVWNQRGKTCVS